MTHTRKVFDDFTINSKISYSLSEYVTLDEKLQYLRNRCFFRKYIPYKPAKYGIKILYKIDGIRIFILWTFFNLSFINYYSIICTG